MNSHVDAQPSLSAIIAETVVRPMDAELLRHRLHEAVVVPEGANRVLVESAIESLARCLESMGAEPSPSPAVVLGAIRQFLPAWELLKEQLPTACDAEVPRKVLANVPAAVREDKQWAGLLKQTEKQLGKEPSRMSISAVTSTLGPALAAKMLRAERNESVLTELVANHGNAVDPRILLQVFKRIAQQGFGPQLAEAFANLKFRSVVDLLPFDKRGTLGQALSRGQLVAIIALAGEKTVTGILRDCRSRKAVETCLEERVLGPNANVEHVTKCLHAFFEGLAGFSDSDSAAMCWWLIASGVRMSVILDSLRGTGSELKWRDSARKAVVNAGLRALAVPELRVRAIHLLAPAADEKWLDEKSLLQFQDALAPQSTTIDQTEDDAIVRWRVCDRVIACLERAAEQNYDRAALSAMIMETLGEFGLMRGAASGDQGLFDSELHETMLWGCRLGEPVLLQTDLLRLDNPETGEIVRRGKVIPVSKAGKDGPGTPTA